MNIVWIVFIITLVASWHNYSTEHYIGAIVSAFLSGANFGIGLSIYWRKK